MQYETRAVYRSLLCSGSAVLLFCCSALLDLRLFWCSDVLDVLCTERDGMKGKSLNALKENEPTLHSASSAPENIIIRSLRFNRAARPSGSDTTHTRIAGELEFPHVRESRRMAVLTVPASARSKARDKALPPDWAAELAVAGTGLVLRTGILNAGSCYLTLK